MSRPEAALLRGAAITALLLVALAAGSVFAEDAPAPDRRLKELESALKKGEAEHEQIKQKAAALAKEAAAVKSDMVSAARAVQEHEETLSELELQLNDLGMLESEKTADLDLKRQQLNGVLTALQRLAFRPSEALIAQPTSPADTVRSAILLRNVVPRIQASAKELKGELDALSNLRLDIGRQKQKISATAVKLDSEHRRLAALYDRKEEVQEEAESQRRETEKRLQSMAAEAEDLRDLMVRLEEEKKRREIAAAEKAAAEKAAREAERIAAKAAAKAARDAEIAAAKEARDAEIAAQKAAHDSEIAAQKAEKEKRQADLAAAREAKQAEEQARIAAKEADTKARLAAKQAELEAKAEKDNRDAAAAAAEEKRAEEKAANQHSFSHAQGEMPFPARGRIAVKFGQNNEVGSPSKGITIETRPNGQVVSPYEGQVVFSGPFRGYGLLLIIEHGEGYHTLLAGMARIDSTVGQRLLAGEPVGVMGQSEGKPLLYVELRRNGQPVNPLPWLTARKTKVSG